MAQGLMDAFRSLPSAWAWLLEDPRALLMLFISLPVVFAIWPKPVDAPMDPLDADAREREWQRDADLRREREARFRAEVARRSEAVRREQQAHAHTEGTRQDAE